MVRIFGKRELDCPEVRKLTSEYLEEGLPTSRMQKFRAHISDCQPCRSFVESLSSMLRMLTRLPGSPAPETLKQSIMEQVRQEESKKS